VGLHGQEVTLDITGAKSEEHYGNPGESSPAMPGPHGNQAQNKQKGQ
jgi:hypothetical protein